MQATQYTATAMDPHNQKMEVVFGTPKCRYFYQTGKRFEARPHLPHSPNAANLLPWRWFPWKIRIRTPALLKVLALITASISLTVLGTQFFANPALAWSALIFINLCFTIPMLYLAYIMNFNFKLREGICWCKGKAQQAREEWTKTTDPSRAKEVFFAWPCGGGLELKVLNDGSQEVWNKNGSELSSELADALGLGGFSGNPDGGFAGNIIGNGGFVEASVSDGAVTDNNKYRRDPNV